MITEFPSVTINFVFAFTYCRVTVHKEQEAFMRQVLAARRVEFLPDNHPQQTWTEWDAGLLLRIVCETLPHLLVLQVPPPYEIVSTAMEGINLTFKKL